MNSKENIPQIVQLTSQTIDNKLTCDANQLVISNFTQVHEVETSRGLSLKICLSERERYILNDKELHYLTPGKYLLVNHNSIVESQIAAKTPCIGLCFYFNSKYLNNVVNCLIEAPEKQIDSIPVKTISYDIAEVCLPFHPETQFYRLIQQIIPNINKINIDEVKEQGADLHFAAACFVAEQNNLIKKNIEKLQQIKQTTKKEILQRLIKAQHIIYENCCTPISITEIARQIGLSEFYFLRMYKQVFQISPYQHILQFRLAKAMDLLQKPKTSASEVAINCGFPDLPSFTKAFKKKFGILPSTIQKN